jgi:hypothetical protein
VGPQIRISKITPRHATTIHTQTSRLRNPLRSHHFPFHLSL